MRAKAPRRLAADDPALAGVLDLIRRSFASMDGRIDPPSSMHRLRLADIAGHCASGEVWAIGAPPFACVFLTPRPDRLYLGKLAVDPARRGEGHGRALVDLAETRARALGLPCLELQTRVELTENHRIFGALGFRPAGTSAHPGYDRPTSITMERAIP
ncbi:GNAT family N-acetyltransferase [Rhodovulum viride]|uniref:GNAT family N-acetyltransferase n=1 Tax=Rhodovulum viride TaxID=1231134 RepID=A0ABX9DFT8_9RHOB|nr:GNAT family N-acetyltransferase [Rhodovulum viride]RAP40445.1 GNAT family N-acetyltransferase [Rhodovulum viride]